MHTLKGYARRILKADRERMSRDLETARMQEIKEVFDMFEVDCPVRPGVRYIPEVDVGNFFIQVGLQMDSAELKDLVQELGDGLDGILFDPTVDFLGGFTSSQLTDQAIDAVFVDIDRDNKNPHKKFDNEITEDEFCAKLSQINPFFGSKGHGGGAEQLIDWLDWAVGTHKINVANKTEEAIEGSHSWKKSLVWQSARSLPVTEHAHRIWNEHRGRGQHLRNARRDWDHLACWH